eukprot:COSAG02_NODE_479_length_21477_cov_49.737674_11_plen_177_part_00
MAVQLYEWCLQQTPLKCLQTFPHVVSPQRRIVAQSDPSRPAEVATDSVLGRRAVARARCAAGANSWGTRRACWGLFSRADAQKRLPGVRAHVQSSGSPPIHLHCAQSGAIPFPPSSRTAHAPLSASAGTSHPPPRPLAGCADSPLPPVGSPSPALNGAPTSCLSGTRLDGRLQNRK